ncbi:MAG: hypothetical protein CMJ75_12105 [Planctomycetaceae bacterium]|nr:hypothetical protein [Planctomycetaceae bacterium]
MPLPITRTSPFELPSTPGASRDLAGASLALWFDDPERERQAAQRLALCDLSALPKAGYKGNGATAWLQTHQTPLPAETFESTRLTDGGIIVKVAADEYFLEAGPSGVDLPVPSNGEFPPDCFPVVREDASLVLCGARAAAVLLQVCGYDFSTATLDRVIYTRVAGVDSAVFPAAGYPHTHVKLWCDRSYAVSLWNSLVEICEEFEGPIIGAQALFTDLP